MMQHNKVVIWQNRKNEENSVLGLMCKDKKTIKNMECIYMMLGQYRRKHYVLTGILSNLTIIVSINIVNNNFESRVLF